MHWLFKKLEKKFREVQLLWDYGTFFLLAKGTTSKNHNKQQYEKNKENTEDTEICGQYNDLHYETKFENHIKNKNNFLSKTFPFSFKQKYIFFHFRKSILKDS